MRIGMNPVPSGGEWERKANPHLIKIFEALTQRGHVIVPLEEKDFTSAKNIADKRIDIIFLHWPASVLDLEKYAGRGVYSTVSDFFRRRCARQNKFYLGDLAAHFFTYVANKSSLLHMFSKKIILLRKIDTICKTIEASGVPFVWEQHDLGAHHLITVPYLAYLDHKLHTELYKVCSAIVVHEYSCVKHVFEAYGFERPYVVAPLGPYSFGTPVSKEEARHRLGINEPGKVIAYIGTARPNRNPSRAIEAFLRIADERDRLFVAGQGVGECTGNIPLDHRIILLDGFLQSELMRDVFCAADFVVNDAERYLTSAVVRAAMTYHVPVIACPFGSNIDMARGAVIFIDEKKGLEEAINRALHMDRSEYDSLCFEASERDKERNWEASGEKIERFLLSVVAGRNA